MNSESRKQFEEWFEPDEHNRESLKQWRTDDGYKQGSWYLCGCWAGWSARDSEVERLREALKAMADEFVKVFPIYYYAEPWAHDKNKVLQDARSLLSSQVKESGT